MRLKASSGLHHPTLLKLHLSETLTSTCDPLHSTPRLLRLLCAAYSAYNTLAGFHYYDRYSPSLHSTSLHSTALHSSRLLPWSLLFSCPLLCCPLISSHLISSHLASPLLSYPLLASHLVYIASHRVLYPAPLISPPVSLGLPPSCSLARSLSLPRSLMIRHSSPCHDPHCHNNTHVSMRVSGRALGLFALVTLGGPVVFGVAA